MDREPYTLAWLVKKAGLTSPYHRNMIRKSNWLDKSLHVRYKENSIGFYGNKGIDKENFMDLQDTSTGPWCSKVARGVINIQNPIFHALEKGLKSKIRKVS